MMLTCLPLSGSAFTEVSLSAGTKPKMMPPAGWRALPLGCNPGPRSRRYDDTGLMVAEPIRWLERYGWRGLTNEERDHLFRFWQAAGERMEQETFRYAASNQRIAEATLGMLSADWPAPLRPLLRRVLQSLLANEVAGRLTALLLDAPHTQLRPQLNRPEPH
jgi:hypothetical protein